MVFEKDGTTHCRNRYGWFGHFINRTGRNDGAGAYFDFRCAIACAGDFGFGVKRIPSWCGEVYSWRFDYYIRLCDLIGGAVFDGDFVACGCGLVVLRAMANGLFAMEWLGCIITVRATDFGSGGGYFFVVPRRGKYGMGIHRFRHFNGAGRLASIYFSN